MLVSCICATHDRRQLIPDAIAAFQAQTLIDSDLIVVDDGEDSVFDLVPSSGRYRYVQVDGKRHFCALRDVGMAFVKGRYVAVWDDDDLSHPERLAVQVAALEESGRQLCLLASSVVRQESPPEEWVYTPSDPFRLDNSAVFLRTVGFRFHRGGKSPYEGLRSLRAQFARSVTTIVGRPELLITRRHGSNVCQRPCGVGAEWTGRFDPQRRSA
jgi:glycosyltransferase involved in cell wall biosynthesis